MNYFDYNKLRKELKKNRMSLTDLQFELAKIGQKRSRPTITKLVRGDYHPTFNDVAAICRLFNKDLYFFTTI